MPVRRFIVFHVEILFRNGHLSYWGIRAVAETTWVDPGVFDSVCGHVCFQASRIYVTLIAVHALVGLVFVVLAPVGLRNNITGIKEKKHKKSQYIVELSIQLILLSREENPGIPVNWRAGWRIFHSLGGCICMVYLQCEFWTNTNIKYSPFCGSKKIKINDNTPAVLLKMTELSEGLLAVRTGVGFDSCVDPDMLRQVARVCKWLSAVGTLVRLWLCVVPNEDRQEDNRKQDTVNTSG